MRKIKREVKIGNIAIGGSNPIAVQTMLSKPANDVKANREEAVRAEKAGCEILRVSVPTIEDVRLIKEIKRAVSIPLVADIHFDYKIALACIDAGVDKIRLNPGNIGGEERVKAVVEKCKSNSVPIRIGVNGGSLEKDLRDKHKGATAAALAESAMRHVATLEKENFHDIVISIKSSSVPVMVEAYKLISSQCDYPLHLGVTEAGVYADALVKNAMGMGILLLNGIGDTVRVSITDSIEKEIDAAYSILRAAGVRAQGVEIISCPTCGRTNIDVAAIANELRDKLTGVKKNLKVAVMGCVVNGIGEGKDADIGIAGGKDSAVLFVKGEQLRVAGGNYLEELLKEIEKL